MPETPTIDRTDFNTDVARALAAEDIRVGDFVALLTETYQYPTYMWNSIDSNVLPPQEPVLVKYKPCADDGPYKVLALCLPFLFVEQASGETRVIDVRKCELARVTQKFARVVFKRRKPKQPGKKSGKSKKRK